MIIFRRKAQSAPSQSAPALAGTTKGVRGCVAAVALVLLATGCGGDEASDQAETPASTTTSESTPTSEAASPSSPTSTEPPPTPSIPTYKIGGTASADQVEMTVTKVEAVELGSRGERGMMETVEVWVETCASKTAAGPWELNPFAFATITRSNQVIPVGTLLSGVREPAYPTYGELPPGRCQEGWVQIVMDKGQARTVKSIEWQPNPGETFAAWTVKQPVRMGVPTY